MINTDVAFRIRFERHLDLPSHSEYEDDRVAEIARRQWLLKDEMDRLDDQLRQIYKEYCDDDSRKSKRDCI